MCHRAAEEAHSTSGGNTGICVIMRCKTASGSDLYQSLQKRTDYNNERQRERFKFTFDIGHLNVSVYMHDPCRTLCRAKSFGFSQPYAINKRSPTPYTHTDDEFCSIQSCASSTNFFTNTAPQVLQAPLCVFACVDAKCLCCGAGPSVMVH